MLIDTDIIRARIRDLEARITKGGDDRALRVVRQQLADSRAPWGQVMTNDTVYVLFHYEEVGMGSVEGVYRDRAKAEAEADRLNIEEGREIHVRYRGKGDPGKASNYVVMPMAFSDGGPP